VCVINNSDSETETASFVLHTIMTS